jgi:hypothetical protein
MKWLFLFLFFCCLDLITPKMAVAKGQDLTPVCTAITAQPTAEALPPPDPIAKKKRTNGILQLIFGSILLFQGSSSLITLAPIAFAFGSIYTFLVLSFLSLLFLGLMLIIQGIFLIDESFMVLSPDADLAYRRMRRSFILNLLTNLSIIFLLPFLFWLGAWGFLGILLLSLLVNIFRLASQLKTLKKEAQSDKANW